MGGHIIMYFSNITNNELQNFHKTMGADFSISLTEILHKTDGVFDNKLFHIEDLGNNIFRVFPLFYAQAVISSNPADNVLDNNCIILIKNSEHETYLSFMTNEQKSNILLNRAILNLKSIGENITLEEFNSFVYRLRRVSNISGDLNYEEINNIQGEYGTYIFNNIQNQLKNDAGLIVNEKLKNNPATIKLVDPFFINAKYILTCTVVSLTGANVCEEGKSDFITRDTFNVELVENMEIPINVNSYINDSVLLFDVTINISFNTPEIINGQGLLNITADNDRIPLGEELVLTATLSGQDNVEGYAVQFFEDGERIGTRTTDENGVAVLPYTPTVSTTHNYSCFVIGLTGNVNVVVYNQNTNLSLNVDNSNIIVDNDITLTGVLTDFDGNVLVNMPISIYENNVLIAELNTDINGEINKTLHYEVPNNYALRAEFTGGEGYLQAQSRIINLNVRKYSTNITLTANNLVLLGNDLTYTVKLEKEGTPFPNQQIKIYDGNTLIQTGITDNNGEYSAEIHPVDPTTYNLKAIYNGTDKIAKAETPVKPITARRTKTYITCEPSKTTVYPDETINFTGTITDEFGNVMPYTRGIKINGEWRGYHSLPYNIPVTVQKVGQNSYVMEHNIMWVDNGNRRDYNYESCTTTVNIACIKFPVTINIQQKEYYNPRETIPIQVTSDDPNFNPESITVTFDGVSYNVTSKDTNGNFIFSVPEITEHHSKNVQISAKYDGDARNDSGEDAKTILVYNIVQKVELTKSGKNFIIKLKDKENRVVPNITIPQVKMLLHSERGDSTAYTENVVFDKNGTKTILLPSVPVTTTMKVEINSIQSNTITVNPMDNGIAIH